MDYLKKLLSQFSDNKKIREYSVNSTARLLFDAYIEEATRDGKEISITLDSTVGELRAALSKLNEEQKTTLCELCPLEKPEDVDNRRLNHWLIKAAVLVFAPIPCMVVGAIIAIGVKSGTVADNPAFSGIIDTATEILKLIFTVTLSK